MTVLVAILLNNGATGGTGVDGLLGSALGINMAQLAAVREMRIENHRSAKEIPREGEA